MLFSAVAVNLNKVGFNFTTDQLFLLTALPSLSGAILRVPYSFMVPIFGGRYWTVLSTVILMVPCIWLGSPFRTRYSILGIYHHCPAVRFCRRELCFQHGKYQFFFPKAKQGSALGINGGLGNLGVSVMQMVAPAVIFLPIFTFLGVHGVPQEDGSLLR
jgi:NNP family nitrate/nitrite transporter-like MFS transporter